MIVITYAFSIVALILSTIAVVLALWSTIIARDPGDKPREKKVKP